MAQLARATGCDAGWGRTCVGCARWLTSISKPFGCRFSGDEASLGDAVTGISRADSASGETELGRCCTNFLWFATAVVSRYFLDVDPTTRLSWGCQHC